MKKKTADNTVNVAVLVSGGGTNLQAIIDRRDAGLLPSCRLCAVISSKKGAYALERAEKAGIKGYTVDRKACAGQEEFEAKILSILNKSRAEVIVLAGFMNILSAEFVKQFPERIINVHPALIPSFCGKGFYGLRVHEEALKYGVKVTGATVHFVNEIPDGGRIIAQKAVKIREGDTPEKLQKRVMREAEWKILPAALEQVCSDILERGAQNG
ncbi:MAG: phosphoribosylglycinamide formyltransferase [Clostridia bacterium]|nr:phosphoribosylglycinamide formyltransferase [Clostridia bacterium]